MARDNEAIGSRRRLPTYDPPEPGEPYRKAARRQPVPTPPPTPTPRPPRQPLSFRNYGGASPDERDEQAAQPEPLPTYVPMSWPVRSPSASMAPGLLAAERYSQQVAGASYGRTPGTMRGRGLPTLVPINRPGSTLPMYLSGQAALGREGGMLENPQAGAAYLPQYQGTMTPNPYNRGEDYAGSAWTGRHPELALPYYTGRRGYVQAIPGPGYAGYNGPVMFGSGLGREGGLLGAPGVPGTLWANQLVETAALPYLKNKGGAGGELGYGPTDYGGGWGDWGGGGGGGGGGGQRELPPWAYGLISWRW